MVIHRNIFAAAFVCSLLSSSVFADIRITNNSRAPITGKLTLSPCSSFAGRAGMIQPHGGTSAIPKKVMDMFCKKSCHVKVYASTNCSGPEIAAVEVDYHHGIVSVQNNHRGFALSGSGNTGQIKDARKAWYDFWS